MADQRKDGIIGNNHGIPAAGKIYVPLIEEMAIKYGIPEVLIAQQMYHESGFNSQIVSSAGAVGLMQVMPDTAKSVAARHNIPSGPLTDARINIELGVAYMAELFSYAYRRIVQDRKEAYKLALVAYYAGPARMSKINEGARMTPGEERYVNNVISDFEKTEKWSQLRLPGQFAKKTAFPWTALFLLGGVWFIYIKKK